MKKAQPRQTLNGHSIFSSENAQDAYYKGGGYMAPILPMHFDKGTQIFRDTTSLPFLDGGPLVDRTSQGKIRDSIYASALGNYYKNGGKFLTANGEYHRIYRSADGNIMVNHPAEDKGQWDTINLTNKANANTIAEGVAATKKWHADNPNVYAQGGMLKRADGSYSPRGLWDNIRANAGSGKEPTEQMLKQEKKINREYADGGQLYTYKGRPGATYQKVNNQWYIQTEHTKGFIPVKDPTGKRTALLNAQATPMTTTTNKYQRTYAPLLDNKPQVAESTVPKNSFDVGMQKSMQNKLNQGAAENQAVRAETINAIKNSATLTKEQKNEILLNPKKIEEYKYLGENVVYGNPNQGTIKEFNPDDRPSRAWEIATNPFTAFEYAVSGGGVENMPRNINEMRMAGIDPGVVQGRNLVGNALNSNLNLLDAGDKVYRNLQAGNYMNAGLEGLRFIPSIGATKTGVKSLAQDAKGVLKATDKLKDLKKISQEEKVFGTYGHDLETNPNIIYKESESGKIIPFNTKTNKSLQEEYVENMKSYYDSPEFKRIMKEEYPDVDIEQYKKVTLENLKNELEYNPSQVPEGASGVYTSKHSSNAAYMPGHTPTFKQKVANANTNEYMYQEDNGTAQISNPVATWHELSHQRTNSDELLPNWLTRSHLEENTLDPYVTGLDYHAKPTEFEVRLRQLKEDLKTQGINDYFTTPITEEHINQLDAAKLKKEGDLLFNNMKAEYRAIKNAGGSEADLEKIKNQYFNNINNLESQIGKTKTSEDTQELLKRWPAKFLAEKARTLPALVPITGAVGGTALLANPWQQTKQD